jgi:hypothetical protein
MLMGLLQAWTPAALMEQITSQNAISLYGL